MPSDPVLLVIFDPFLRQRDVDALESNFAVTAVSGVREADFALQDNSFKVLLAERLLQDGDGFELLVRARKDYPRMRRILQVDYIKTETLLEIAEEADLFRYLLKPVAIPELLRTVAEAVKAYDEL